MSARGQWPILLILATATTLAGPRDEPGAVRWQRLVAGDGSPGEICRIQLDAEAARDCPGLPDGVALRDAHGIWIPFRVSATRAATNLLFEAGLAKTLVLEGREGPRLDPPRSLRLADPADARLMSLGPRLSPDEPKVKYALRNLALQSAGVLALLVLALVVTRTALRRYAR